MGISEVERGDPLKAAKQSELIRQVNRNTAAEITGDVEPAWGPEGDSSFVHDRPEIAIFELTEDPHCPSEDTEDYPQGWYGKPDVPWAMNCRPVWFWNDRNQYGTTWEILGLEDKLEDVYFPTLECCETEILKYTAGCRFHVRFNRQAGRWEAILDPVCPCSSSSGSSSSSSSGVSSSSSSSSGVSSSSSSSSGVSSSSSSGSSSSSSSGSSSGPCETCFEGLCLEDIPTVASLSEGDFVLAIQDGCLVKVAVTDCTSSSGA